MLDFLFFIFKFNLILCCFMVIFSSNPVHSVIFLILTFFNGSIIFLLLKAEFIAIIYMVVYMGAIAVLFLFVVMMLDVRSTIGFYKSNYNLLSFFILFLLSSEVILLFYNNFNLNFFSINNDNFYYFNWLDYLYDLNNIKLLGQVIYTYHFVFFILCGLILLSSMISSISLTLSNKLDSKKQNIHNQVLKLSSNTIYFSKKIF